MAADFETDVADGFLVGEKVGLAADFEADVADGRSVGEVNWLFFFSQLINQPINQSIKFISHTQKPSVKSVKKNRCQPTQFTHQ